MILLRTRHDWEAVLMWNEMKRLGKPSAPFEKENKAAIMVSNEALSGLKWNSPDHGSPSRRVPTTMWCAGFMTPLREENVE